MRVSISSESAISSLITVANLTNYPMIEQILVFRVGEFMFFNIWMKIEQNSELINQLAAT